MLVGRQCCGRNLLGSCSMSTEATELFPFPTLGLLKSSLNLTSWHEERVTTVTIHRYHSQNLGFSHLLESWCLGVKRGSFVVRIPWRLLRKSVSSLHPICDSAARPGERRSRPHPLRRRHRLPLHHDLPMHRCVGSRATRSSDSQMHRTLSQRVGSLTLPSDTGML